MKSINHIYPHLTPRAAAMVAWGLMHDGRDSEAERVTAAVPREYRLGPVLEFGHAIVWLQAIAQCWTVMHWKMMCAYEQEKSAFLLSGDDTAMSVRYRLLGEAEGRLLACDGALDTAARERGFDAETVRRQALTVRFAPMVSGVSKDAALELDLLAALLGEGPEKPQGADGLNAHGLRLPCRTH